MRTLVLLRHAQAEPHAPRGRDDHARALTARGREDAGEVRRWLVDEGLLPDRALVSTATRARQTWELARPGGADPAYDDRLYEATVADLRELVAETPADTAVLVLVGHNPGLERLAWELDDSLAAREQTDRGMGTAGVAVFALTSWSDEHGSLLALRR